MKRDFLVKTIHTGTTGVNKMLDGMMPATFQNIGITNHIGIYINLRVFYTVTHAGLGGQMTDLVKFFDFENFGKIFPICNIQTDKPELIPI
jgi:hypothetical protein